MPSEYLNDLNEIIESMSPYASQEGLDLIREAFFFAEEKHSGRKRASGEPFFTHCINTAKILNDLVMDPPTIAAGLLHDVIELEKVSLGELRERFGGEVAFLVNGVTKIAELESELDFFGSKDDYQARKERDVENYRKFTIAVAKDVRVVIIKLADRLHNMRTLEYLPPDKQKRIALETAEIYAPLAHRLGIFKIKEELENLAFKHLNPERYRQIRERLEEGAEERERLIKEIVGAIKELLESKGVSAEVYGRSKTIFSVHKKLERLRLSVDNMHDHIYDLIGFRVIVESDEKSEKDEKGVANCWTTLGWIHTKWTPIPGRLKDYISIPKSNGYQSLHTTVIISGRPVEIQIRSERMNRTAEYGVAAHWKYKVGDKGKTSFDDYVKWLRELVEEMRDVKHTYQYILSLKEGLALDEIYVLTPKGDLKVLPRDATPIDFAYAVHTEVGHHCVGAKVTRLTDDVPTEMFVSLKSKLQTGDRVEIITDENAKPSRDWLRIVKSSRARSKIRKWLKVYESKQYLELGERLVRSELKFRHLPVKLYMSTDALSGVARKLNYRSIESALMDVGYGKISAQHFVNVLMAERKKIGWQLMEEEFRRRGIDPKAYLIPDKLEELGQELKFGSAENLLLDLSFNGDQVSSYANQLINITEGKRIDKDEIVSERKPESTGGVIIDGIDHAYIRVAKCCNPIPGDEIVGYVTQRRGLTIHVLGCPRIGKEIERIVPVAWSPEEGVTYPASIVVESTDRIGLLRDITNAISSLGVNITHVHSGSVPTISSIHKFIFTVDVTGTEQLQKIINAIERVKNVRPPVKRRRPTLENR